MGWRHCHYHAMWAGLLHYTELLSLPSVLNSVVIAISHYVNGACSDRIPTRTGKPGKMGRHFPVREKSGNFEQTGKVRENHTKYWKTEINWDKYYLIFLVIFKWTVHYLLKWIKFSVKKKNKTLKKYWKNGKKYWKSQGILSVRKSGNPEWTWLETIGSSNKNIHAVGRSLGGSGT